MTKHNWQILCVIGAGGYRPLPSTTNGNEPADFKKISHWRAAGKFKCDTKPVPTAVKTAQSVQIHTAEVDAMNVSAA